MSKSTWTSVQDVMAGMGMKPSEWLRKEMPQIDWDATLEPTRRRTWQQILTEVGIDKLHKILNDWQNSKWYPHAWDLYTQARLEDKDREWVAETLSECRKYGWFNPTIRDKKLRFMSLWKTEHIRSEAAESEWRAVETQYSAFVKEPVDQKERSAGRLPGDDSDWEDRP